MVRRVVPVAVGAYVCLLGSLVHRHGTELAGVTWPWGLVLVLVATLATAVGAQRVWPVGAAWFGLGWAGLLVLQQVSPGGSYLVAADGVGWSFTLLGLGGVAAVVVLAPRLER